ncbi:Uncharacterized protein conserved in bacteria,Protein of unknown function (DUF1343) [Chlamydia serpentis]|uniref:DUF1343 domain-containing protein n=1 Tax=Chlamydia serpentis TaxID=1967782 RepID=A0A2R8FC14_9CHLA|nr:exo-beta-N-acetylmuramidase NamZ domain-containing protein [Chlamydia serpentis]SPN73891.1 Uncharacterized protein conserved in bacteria,Protein of unknown function (DUF1343) [Chlamydia serpentis]
MKRIFYFFLFLSCIVSSYESYAQVIVGLDRIFSEEPYLRYIQGKKIALISHNAAINSQGKDALSVFCARQNECTVSILCTLEHGYYGATYIETLGRQPSVYPNLPHLSLHGLKELPKEVAQHCDIFVYDVQDIGVRSYSFVTVLMQIVKAAEQYGKQLIILDRPNPMGGMIIDGPVPNTTFLDSPAIPYCYGMTPGELALFFKKTYASKADVVVVPMKGWNRSMIFDETGLIWIPTSPQIPDSQSAFFYATTGILGALSVASIGVGYTLPFRVLGAPWMDGVKVADELNRMQLPGILFLPFFYEPFFGKYKMEMCSGVLLVLQDPKIFYPVETQYTIWGVLKALYPKQVEQTLKSLDRVPARRSSICSLLGGEDFLTISHNERYVVWPLRRLCKESREHFYELRRSCLLSEYSECY